MFTYYIFLRSKKKTKLIYYQCFRSRSYKNSRSYKYSRSYTSINQFLRWLEKCHQSNAQVEVYPYGIVIWHILQAYQTGFNLALETNHMYR